MRDRTEEIRSVIQRYPSFDFVPLRVENAFDDSWWNTVSGSSNIARISLELGKEGLIADGRVGTRHVFNILTTCCQGFMLLHK
jgi:cytoplasmic tRNA 2-thiolation protein 2